jgi:hypothetical protein
MYMHNLQSKLETTIFDIKVYPSTQIRHSNMNLNELFHFGPPTCMHYSHDHERVKFILKILAQYTEDLQSS